MKKNYTSPISSSSSEYLTFIASTGTDDTAIEVRYEDENIWLTQKMMAELYGVSVPAINQHLKTLIEQWEIDVWTIKKYLIVGNEWNREVSRNIDHYNLQAIISVGFKIENERAIQFRKWAREIVKQYTVQGWTMDVERLKKWHKFTNEFFERQLAIIREIRASERMFYQKITDIYTTAIDYDKTAKTTLEFFAKVQNKLHFAVHRHTAAEIIVERVDAEKKNMWLTTRDAAPAGKIQKFDVSIAKNYLTTEEMRYLDRIVAMYLDYAELQSERKIPMTMEDRANRLDSFLEFNRNEILTDAGKISHEEAKLYAETQYEKYRMTQDRLFESDFDKFIQLQNNIKGIEE